MEGCCLPLRHTLKPNVEERSKKHQSVFCDLGFPKGLPFGLPEGAVGDTNIRSATPNLAVKIGEFFIPRMGYKEEGSALRLLRRQLPGISPPSCLYNLS